MFSIFVTWTTWLMACSIAGAHGGRGKIVEAPYNGVRAKAFTASTSDITFTTDNKPGMHVRSVLSEDGKVMTTKRQHMSGPAKAWHVYRCVGKGNSSSIERREGT
jgi:hypothetical protein